MNVKRRISLVCPVFSYREAVIAHLALYASLVDKLVDEVGRDAGLGCGGGKIEDLTR